jgi:hypothetical protein
MHLLVSFRQTRWPAVVPLLILLALILAGCSLVAGPQEGTDAGSEATAPTATEESNVGTLIIDLTTVPAGQSGAFLFTGVPSGTITTDNTLVVTDLAPGTYTTTERNPAPDFDVTAVDCDDGDSTTPSSGDAQTRTAVLNLDEGETIRCTFTNAQRGSVVVASRTNPEGAAGNLTFTGVPSGTIPSNGTLVVANLAPGTYTTTQVDPDPIFDVTAVECDDGGSATPSSGDPGSRTAVFNLDPGEMVTCTYANTRHGTLVVASQTTPEGAAGTFSFTGVPSGTIPSDGTLVVADLSPGTYTTTQVDPTPEFDLASVECDDEGSPTLSSADPDSRTAVFQLDPGETVTCTFINAMGDEPELSGGESSSAGTTSGAGAKEAPSSSATNPFENPDPKLENLPLPENLPPDAGTFDAPKPGPWTVVNYAGQMVCGGMNLAIPASAPENGILEVLDGGQTVIGTGLQENQASITMRANPQITGRYSGAFEGTEQGVPVTIDYFWQVVTDEYIVGFLTSSFTSEGVTCNIYRAYEMNYTG